MYHRCIDDLIGRSFRKRGLWWGSNIKAKVMKSKLGSPGFTSSKNTSNRDVDATVKKLILDEMSQTLLNSIR